jgi:hypothetical protein
MLTLVSDNGLLLSRAEEPGFYKAKSTDPVILKYEVVRNDKVIGKMEAVKRDRGNMIEYQMESFVSVSLIIQLSIYTKVVGVFHQGQLVSGSVIRKVNDNTKVNAKIILQNDRYLIQEEDERSELNEKIMYTSACLMHLEPIGLKRIFSENYKKFVAVRELRPHYYELQLPDGNKNFYSYANGICIGAEVNTNLSKAFFRLKK